jgi:type III pantothenate kinase
VNIELLSQWPWLENTPSCLLVDAGNTEVKALLVQEATRVLVWRCPSAQWVQPLGLEQVLAGFVEQYPQVQHIAMSNVLGPPLQERLQAWCEQHGLLLFVTTANNHPQLQTRYAQPEQLGQDRWSAVLAVALCSQSSCNVVFSLGTATTLDALVCSNVEAVPWVHLGGYIVPGAGTMLHALAQNTAQLPSLPQNAMMHTDGPTSWPTNTQQAMGAGVVAMQQQFILGMAQALSQSQGGVPVQCWVLGGYARHPAFLPLLARAGVVHWPDAVFYGLYAAWHHHLLGGV